MKTLQKADDLHQQKFSDFEERLKEALLVASTGTWKIDLTTGVDSRDASLNRILGLPAIETITPLEDSNKRIHPDDAERTIEALEKAIAEVGVYDEECRIIRPDGTVRWLRDRGRVVCDDEGKPSYIIGAATDITDLKEAQEALRRSAEELDTKVKERTKELQEANEQLAQTNAELERFAYVTSHDLQEPLRKIKIFAYRIEDELQFGNVENALKFLSKVTTSSERMTTLITDLLNYSRLSKESLKFEKIDLNTVLDEVLEDFEVLIQQKNATIYKEDLPVVKGNAIQLNQLFYNLISNALKFSKDNFPPTLRIECRKAETEALRSLRLPKKNYYELSFSDNGIGFSKKFAHQIFEIFQRLHSKDHYPGTGIGLALSKKVVQNHGGGIVAESEEGSGSVFKVYLPLN
jgi:PAS domain S-box-containing protein